MKDFVFKIYVFVFFTASLYAGFFWLSPALALTNSELQAQINTDSDQIAQLNQKIAEYQAELKQTGADKKTLQATIHSLDLQRSSVEAKIAVTQKQINTTQLQIQQLGTQITDKKQRVRIYKDALAEALRDISKADNHTLIVQFFLARGFQDFWGNINETMMAQDVFLEKARDLKTEQESLSTAKTAVEQKQIQLAAQNKDLAAQKLSLNVTVKSKNQLLIQTNNKESTYQKLLAQAQAELKSYSNFTKNAGGTQLLSNQTSCDAWGCYYNQRDILWGRQPLNGTEYSLASDGCLVTAMAMVMTHYGHKSVTPVTINSNPDNFASYYPAYLLYTINADGATATRVAATIDAILAVGNPVIIGLKVYGGTHFVVLVSGSGGTYIMRDPYLANGKDISFTSHYTLKSIYSITKVVVNG